jgi:hypothetical protein
VYRPSDATDDVSPCPGGITEGVNIRRVACDVVTVSGEALVNVEVFVVVVATAFCRTSPLYMGELVMM